MRTFFICYNLKDARPQDYNDFNDNTYIFFNSKIDEYQSQMPDTTLLIKTSMPGSIQEISNELLDLHISSDIKYTIDKLLVIESNPKDYRFK
jgi:hypothetical protein